MLAYVDPGAGLAGDMLLGALVDAGWPEDRLLALPRSLGLESSVRVKTRRVRRGALAALRVEVSTREDDPPHRGPEALKGLFEAGLPRDAADRALRVVDVLASAEAAVHGWELEAVHFHEVGGVDAAIDIAGVALALTELRVDELWCGPLPAVEGWVDTAHGRLPLPAPATARILADAGAPVVPAAPGVSGELVTPTGAALVAALARWGRPGMRVAAVGQGAGSRDPEAVPNITRVWLGDRMVDAGAEAQPAGPVGWAEVGEVAVLETHVDDMTPEALSQAAERLRDLGALDVSVTSLAMKKGRTGARVTVVARPSLESALAGALLEETTSLGVRLRRETRWELPRRLETVQTPFGAVAVKLRRRPSGALDAKPEYDDCVRAARERGATWQEVWESARASARRAIEEGTWTWS